MSFHKISAADPASDFTSSVFGSQQYAQKTKMEEHVHDQISYMLPNNARKIEILKFQCSFIEPPPFILDQDGNQTATKAYDLQYPTS